MLPERTAPRRILRELSYRGMHYGPSNCSLHRDSSFEQYSQYVPHDTAKLIELQGGDEKFIERLDFMFEEVLSCCSSMSRGRTPTDIHLGLLRFHERALSAYPLHVPLRQQARTEHAAFSPGDRTVLQHVYERLAW